MKTVIFFIIAIIITLKVLFASFDSMSSEMKQDATHRLQKMEQTTK